MKIGTKPPAQGLGYSNCPEKCGCSAGCWRRGGQPKPLSSDTPGWTKSDKLSKSVMSRDGGWGGGGVAGAAFSSLSHCCFSLDQENRPGHRESGHQPRGCYEFRSWGNLRIFLHTPGIDYMTQRFNTKQQNTGKITGIAEHVCPSLGNLEKGLTHVPPGDLSRCDCLRRDFVKGGPQHRDGERPSHISLWVRQQLPADPPLQEFLTAAGQSGTLPAVPC